MRFLIIGGAGLLGTYLAPALTAQGHEVAICDNFTGSIQYRTSKEYRIFTPNVCDLNATQYAFTVFRPEAIILATAQSLSRDNAYTFHDDVKSILDGTNVVAFLLDKTIKHVYFCSSYEVYGGPQSSKPLKETRKIIYSSSHHGTAKLAAESILALRCQELKIPLTVLRIFDMFGPRILFSPRSDAISFLIDGFIKQEMLGLLGAKKARDFIHVKDVVTAICGLVEANFEGIINIGTGKGTTLRNIVLELGKHIPINDIPLEMRDGKLPTFSSVADVSKLNSLFSGKWEPKENIVDSLPELISFRKKELEFYSRSNPQAVLNAMRGINNV